MLVSPCPSARALCHTRAPYAHGTFVTRCPWCRHFCCAASHPWWRSLTIWRKGVRGRTASCAKQSFHRLDQMRGHRRLVGWKQQSRPFLAVGLRCCKAAEISRQDPHVFVTRHCPGSRFKALCKLDIQDITSTRSRSMVTSRGSVPPPCYCSSRCSCSRCVTICHTLPRKHTDYPRNHLRVAFARWHFEYVEQRRTILDAVTGCKVFIQLHTLHSNRIQIEACPMTKGNISYGVAFR
jgi:hypothetical protein